MPEPFTTGAFYLAAKEVLYWGEKLEKIVKILNDDQEKLSRDIDQIVKIAKCDRIAS